MGETVFPGVKAHGAVRISDFANLVDGEVVVIGSDTYEFRNSEGSITPGNHWVHRETDEATTIANLITKINAIASVPKIDAYVDSIDTKVARIEAHREGTGGNVAFTTDFSDSGNVIAAVGGLLAGGQKASLKHRASDRYVVTTIDVLAGCIMIPTGLVSPKIESVQVFSSAGLRRAETTLWTVAGTRIKGDFDGATSPIEGDTVSWQARD